MIIYTYYLTFWQITKALTVIHGHFNQSLVQGPAWLLTYIHTQNPDATALRIVYLPGRGLSVQGRVCGSLLLARYSQLIH